MKKVLLAIALLSANLSFAQIQLPQASGAAEVDQTIGYTKIEVDYARPNLKNRTAFGGELVPYGQLWRTGANTNTTIDISTDVTVEGKTLAKGKYAIFTIPTEKHWEVIFYTKTDNWGTPEKLDEALVALKVKVPVMVSKEKVETFTIGFQDAFVNKTKMTLAWDKTLVQVNIEANTFEMAEAEIKKTLNENASARDFFSAATYYYNNNLDMKQALVWINKAIEKDSSVPYYQGYKTKIEKAIKK